MKQKIRELEESKNSFFRYEGLKLYLFWGGMVCNILVFLMLLYGMISCLLYTSSIPSCKVDLAPLYEKPRRKSTVTLEEAKELYTEWYEKRIVQGEPKQKSKKQGGTWVCNEALYEW